MVRRKTSTLLRASLTASSFDGWMMARISFMSVPWSRRPGGAVPWLCYAAGRPRDRERRRSAGGAFALAPGPRCGGWRCFFGVLQPRQQFLRGDGPKTLVEPLAEHVQRHGIACGEAGRDPAALA